MPLKLIIMRHGEAGRHQSDAARPLTDRGREESDRVAQAMAADWRPRAIWCSPLTRARQTARIIADRVSLDVTEQPFLKPEDPPELAIEALQKYRGDTPLVLVSHMPLVGVLAGLLVEGRAGQIPFATSQAVCLEMDIAAAGCAEFCKLYLPDDHSR